MENYINKIKKQHLKKMWKIFLRFLSENNMKYIFYNLHHFVIDGLIYEMNKRHNFSPLDISVSILSKEIFYEHIDNFNITNWEKYYYKIIFKKDIEELFEQFLIKENAYDAYISYIKKYNGNKSFNENLEYKHVHSFIMSSFCWSITNEGQSYWGNLHKKWNVTIKEMYNSYIHNM